MIRNIFLLALLCMAAFPATSHANGAQLLSQCNSVIRVLDGDRLEDPIGAGYCMGLMQGIIETTRFYQDRDKSLACLPEGLEKGQAARVVTKFLNEHPERLHETSALLAIVALATAFPCARGER